MKSQLNHNVAITRVAKVGVSVIFAAVLSACANYAGIHSDKEMAQPQTFATQQSLPARRDTGRQRIGPTSLATRNLKALIGEALKGSPTLEQARARVAAASAYSETAKANTLPQVGATYSYTRQLYSGTALVPPRWAVPGNRRTRVS